MPQNLLELLSRVLPVMHLEKGLAAHVSGYQGSLFPRFVSRTRLKQFNRTRRVALTGFHKGQNHWNVEFILPGAHRETLGQIVGQILGLSQFTCARESISCGNRLVTLTKAGLGHEHATTM